MDKSALINEVKEELTAVYENQPTYNAVILHDLVTDAYRKVRARKCYENTSKNEEQINNDLYLRHFQDIKNVARYNFAKLGGDFEISHSENGTSRSWISEDEVLGNVNAFVGFYS